MKKKILSLLLALLMASSSAGMIAANSADESAAEASITAEATDRLLGDIDNNGVVDIQDAMALFQHSMLPEMFPIDYPGSIDLDKNGTVDLNDAMRLFQYSMLPEQFPIEWGDIVEDTPYPVDKLTINGTDISEYVIACNASAGGVISNAASQLQKYLELTTGVKLDIMDAGVPAGTKRILIDETVVTDPDNFKYYTDNDGLVLAGSAKRSALYAVFNFLEEQLGWRFFAADTEVCYETSRIDVSNLDYSFEQAFEIRDVYWTEAFDEEFSIKRYLNGDGKRRKMYNDNPESIALGGSENFHPYGIHTFAQLSETGDHEQPCLNDETVYATMLKNIKAWLSEDPSHKAIHVSQNDNQNWCMCDACWEDIDNYGTPAASIVKLMNRLDNDLKAAGFEDITLITFAYQYSFDCPTGIKCNDDVAIELTTITYCYNHAFDDPNCETNVKNMEQIRKWSEICSQFYIWDYSINFKYYLSPFPNFDVIRQNMKVLSEVGAIGILSQGNYQCASGEFGALRSYLLAKLMQDPDMTEAEYNNHMNEFLEAYYGPGWENIKAYIDYFTDLANTKNSCFDIYASPEVMFGDHAFAPANEQLIEWFATALEMAETDLQVQHIRQSQVCCEYLRIGAIHQAVTTSGDRHAVEQIRVETDALFAACQEFGLRVAENCELPYAIRRRNNPRTWWSLHYYTE